MVRQGSLIACGGYNNSIFSLFSSADNKKFIKFHWLDMKLEQYTKKSLAFIKNRGKRFSNMENFKII